MMRGTPSKLLFLILASLLGYLNWHAWNEPIDAAIVKAGPGSEGVADRGMSKSPQTVVVAGLDTYKETLERPLFQQNRRPFVAEPPKVESPPPSEPAATTTAPVDPVVVATPPSEPDPSSNVRLLGTMKAGATVRRALLQIEGRSKAVWIEEGADLGDWKVREIRDEKVVLETAGARHIVELRPSRSSGVSAN